MVIIIIATVIVISIIDVIFLIRIAVIFTIFTIIVIIVVLCYAVFGGLSEVHTTVLREVIWQIKIVENPLVYMETKTDVYFTVELSIMRDAIYRISHAYICANKSCIR